MANGDSIIGSLQDIHEDDPAALLWQHPGFAQPFQFKTQAISTISFPIPDETNPATGEFALELTHGDRLFGSIQSIDPEYILVRTAELGDVSVLRSEVRRLSRWQDGDAVICTRLGDLQEWTDEQNSVHWQEQSGQFSTSQNAVSVFRDIGLPSLAQVEIGLSWTGTPNFVLDIGAQKNRTEASAAATRVEVWKNDVVLVREQEGGADVAVLGEWAKWNGRLQLLLTVDQETGCVEATSLLGESLATLRLPPPDPTNVSPGIRLTNIQGTVRFDSLRVMRLDHPENRSKTPGQEVVFLEDDEALSGQWTDVNREEDDSEEDENVVTWTLHDEETEHSVDPNDVLSIEFADSPDTKKLEEAGDEGQGNSILVQVINHSGIRLTGTIQAVQNGQLKLVSDRFQQALSFPVSGIRRITVVGPASSETERSKGGSDSVEMATLKMPGGPKSLEASWHKSFGWNRKRHINLKRSTITTANCRFVLCSETATPYQSCLAASPAVE